MAHTFVYVSTQSPFTIRHLYLGTSLCIPSSYHVAAWLFPGHDSILQVFIIVTFDIKALVVQLHEATFQHHSEHQKPMISCNKTDAWTVCADVLYFLDGPCTLGEEHNACSLALCNILHSPVIFISLLVLNIYLCNI